MINYLLSVLYIILFLLSMLFIGNSLFNKNGNIPIRIIYSYVLYKFVASFFGVLISFFKLPYITFQIIMIAFWIIVLGYSFYKKKHDNIRLSKDEIKDNVKKYWFIPIITLVLLFFSIINIQYHWFGNHLDDGYYVNGIYDYVNNVDTYSINPGSGFIKLSKFDQYSLNTWQMESAFFAKTMHIEPSIFLKIGQSFVNYFLLSVLIVAFLEKILPQKKAEKYKYELQFVPMALLLFIFQFDVLNILLFLQDGWQFGNAIYYGSTIIRTMGMFLLLLPFIDKTKIKFVDFIMYGIFSFVLLAQSAVALPVVIVIGLSYIIAHFIFECSNKIKNIFLIIVLILLLIVGVILPNISSINDHAIYLIGMNKFSILFFIILIAWLTGFLYKEKLINKINTILLIIICFMYIPELNDITENLSVYDFVEARLWTGLFYTITILAFTNAFIFFCEKCNKKVFTILKIFVFIILIIGACLSFYFKNINIIDSLRIIKNNPKFLPNSTIVLGEKLENIYNEKHKDLYVLTSDWVWIKKYDHSLAVLLRQHAKDIKVVSAIPRFSDLDNPEFSDYSQKDNDIFNHYIIRMDKGNSNKLKEILNKYPINCLVSIKKIPSQFLKEINYEYSDNYCDDDICYYIYYKN